MSLSPNNALVSIILPVYNREKTIERAVNSVINQTISNWELIIIDDGSTDNTGVICDNYMHSDSRIKVFHTDNHGAYHARNIGLEHASGTWVGFHDSDDEYVETAFEEMLRYSDVGVDLIVGTALCFPKAGMANRVGVNISFSTVFDVQSRESIDCLLARLYTFVCGKLFRRESIKIKFDDSFTKRADCIFMLEMLLCISKIAYTPCIVCHFYKGADNSLDENFHICEIRAQKRIFEITCRIFDYSNVKKWASRFFVFSSICFFINIILQPNVDYSVKLFLTQSQLEENVMPITNRIDVAPFPETLYAMWKVLCSGNAIEVINFFETDSDSKCKAAEEFGNNLSNLLSGNCCNNK